MITFKDFIYENNTAGGDNSVFGDVNSGNPTKLSDWYAPGDNRIPKIFGAKNKKKSKYVQKRPKINGM